MLKQGCPRRAGGEDRGWNRGVARRQLPPQGTTNHLDDASYGAAGNQTGWLWNASAGRYRYLYDHDRLNRMRALNGPSLNRVFAYTADGERLVERDLTSGVTTFSLRGLDGKVLREITLQAGASTWLKDYVYRDGQLLASQGDSEALRHYHLDHLGTPRMLTNRCGERVKRYDYFPFGQAVNELPQDPEKMRFTGHQRDLGQLSTSQDDLDYLHQRYLNPNLARFASVDSGAGIAGMPLSWNRYSYTAGNPVKRVDPDGRTFTDFVNGAVNGFGSSMLMNAGRVTPVNADMAYGQALGDAWAVYVGALEAEMGAGAILGGSGGTVVSGGSAAAISLPVAAGGAAMVVQGSGAVVTGVTNLAKFAVVPDSGRGGAYRRYEKNPGEWERVQEVPDSRQEAGGHSRRVLLRNKNTGEEMWIHELKQKKPPQHPHPHPCEPPTECQGRLFQQTGDKPKI